MIGVDPLHPLNTGFLYLRNWKEDGKGSSDSVRVVVLPIVDQPSPDCLNKGFQITQPQGVSRVLSVSQGGNKEEGGEGRGQRILKGAAPLEGFGGCRPPNVTALSSITCPLPAPSHN